MTDWRDQAACKGMDSDVFFPDGQGRGGSNAITYRRALAICGNCEVTGECLEYSLMPNQRAQFGIWGGMTTRQRRKVKR